MKKDRQGTYYSRNRAAILARKRACYAANKAAYADRAAARRAADPERARAFTRAYHARNRAEMNGRSKQWRELHPDKAKQLAAQYRKNHPESAWQRDGRARARAAGAPTGDARLMREWRATWMSRPLVRCFWCKRDFAPSKCHADHMEPLASGGAHSVENLCISCASCNIRKGPKTVSQWTSAINTTSTQGAA